MIEFIAVLSLVKKLIGSRPRFTNNALINPVLGLELYKTVQRTAITTIDVNCGLKYIVLNTDTPLNFFDTNIANANANAH